MLINTHCHIFNLQSVFTPETVNILEERLRSTSMSKGLQKALIKLLNRIMMSKSNVKPAGPSGMPKKRSRKAQPVDDIDEAWIRDACRFIGIGLSDTMDDVTDILLDDMEPEDIIVPMMMDITDGKGTDTKLFNKQASDTLRQCLRYPGRVLPFYAFNPIRAGGKDRMEAVINQGAFVGMKLYPSLGYKINLKGKTHMALDKIELANKEQPGSMRNDILEALQLCNDNDFPVMQHSSRGGFCAHVNYIDYGHPRHWRDILYPGGKGPYLDKLKVCFAHLGGAGRELATCWPPTPDKKSWAAETLCFMDGSSVGHPPNPHIFTDISDVTDMKPYVKFFNTLLSLLNHKTYGRQILWGTDYFLVQLTVTNKGFTDKYMERVRTELREKLISGNPQRFLGLDLANPAASARNIRKHVKYLWDNKSDLDMDQAAKWVKPILELKTLPPEFNVKGSAPASGRTTSGPKPGSVNR